MISRDEREKQPVFHVFIDETGTFSYLQKRNSFVSGWVVADKHEKQLNKTLRKCVNEFNENMKEKGVGESVLYPNHLHFMPLHYKNRRINSDAGISIDPVHVPILVNSIFNALKDKSLLVFRSSGMPFIIPHEQAGYMEVLRHTLVQLLHDPVFGQDVKIIITIGHRRSKMLYGEGHKQALNYERHLSEQLSTELLQSFTQKKRPNIQIIFDDARNIPGLIIADFFCGAFRNDCRGYLKDYNSSILRNYYFSKGYRLVGVRAVQQLSFFETIDPVAALVQCMDMLSDDMQNEEIQSLFDGMFQRLDESMKKSFFESAQNFITEIIVGNADRYAQLDHVKNMLDLLRGHLTLKIPSGMSPSELRMMAEIQLNEIRIESHKGRTDVSMLQDFLSFLDQYGDLAFENQLAIMQRRIDAILLGIQVSAFNTFRFEEVDGFLREYRDRYKDMFRVELARTGARDGNLARLEGTLGQMDGFLCDINREVASAHFDAAEDSLKNDIAACVPGSRNWEQGMGYLTALYWKNGDLDKAIPQLLEEAGQPGMNRNNVFNLKNLKALGCEQKPFIFMHRLNICALAQKKGKTITGQDSAADFLLQNKRLSQYPEMLSAKWMAILYGMEAERNEKNAQAIVYKGHDALALDVMERNLCQSKRLLDAALDGGNDGGYTIQVLRLPLKLCKHLILKKLCQPSQFDCQKEVACLDKIQPGAEHLLKKLGIEKYYGNEDTWNFYDIGTLLPFYYS